MASKEVYFFEYCDKCKHKTLSESDEPCNECLTYAMNDDSHKPVNFKPKEE